MDNNSFSEADFPGKRCVFSEPSPLRVLSALSRCPHAGICGVCVQRSWGIAASSHTPLSSTLSLLVPPVCVGRGGESSTWDCFPGSCAVLALDAFVDQSRRTGFHLDPADPCARRFREVERAGSREFSWEPAKADHQRCLVCRKQDCRETKRFREDVSPQRGLFSSLPLHFKPLAAPWARLGLHRSKVQRV